jgi:ribonuclease Z
MTLRVTFLGTSGAGPTTERNPSGLLVNRDGDRLLFDCGEGIQRQMMHHGTGFDLDQIFVTHLHGDHVYGLPGLLETLDFNGREDPLTLHVPPGQKGAMKTFVDALGARPDFPLRIHEVGYDAAVLAREEYEVRSVEVDHRTVAVGYALIESKRKGRFDRERAEELGVPVGPKFSRLHDGHSVELEDGRVIEPDQVVGPPRPGRRVLYTGDTRPTETVLTAAENADLLIHDASFADDHADRARETGHSTAREAGQIADDAGARRLAMTHISSRYTADVSDHERQAATVFSGDAFVPDDGDSIEIPFPNGE